MLSCLYITYNRSSLLEKSLNSIRENLRALPMSEEFVVADDCSSEAHLNVIELLPFDTRVIAKKNMGLGANSNKGILACKGEYILQLQDDWLFVGKSEDILRALAILESDPQVGIVQLNITKSDLQHEHKTTAQGGCYIVFPNDFLPWNRSCGFRPYSDQPHIKRRQFVEDLGPYLEGVPMTEMENQYKKRVANQSRWKVACLSQTDSLFEHLGEALSFRLMDTDTIMTSARIHQRIYLKSRSVVRAILDYFDSFIAKAVYRVRR
jgi:glycosyltransferase involved in cell wall biosynthesis